MENKKYRYLLRIIDPAYFECDEFEEQQKNEDFFTQEYGQYGYVLVSAIPTEVERSGRMLPAYKCVFVKEIVDDYDD